VDEKVTLPQDPWHQGLKNLSKADGISERLFKVVEPLAGDRAIHGGCQPGLQIVMGWRERFLRIPSPLPSIEKLIQSLRHTLGIAAIALKPQGLQIDVEGQRLLLPGQHQRWRQSASRASMAKGAAPPRAGHPQNSGQAP
jgi:hypothetical protein